MAPGELITFVQVAHDLMCGAWIDEGVPVHDGQEVMCPSSQRVARISTAYKETQLDDSVALMCGSE